MNPPALVPQGQRPFILPSGDDSSIRRTTYWFQDANGHAGTADRTLNAKARATAAWAAETADTAQTAHSPAGGRNLLRATRQREFPPHGAAGVLTCALR
jgi:hypothetical protein